MGWLFPEREGPSKLTAFNHSLVACPCTIDQQVQTESRAQDLLDRRFNFVVIKVIATNADHATRQISGLNRSSRGEHVIAGIREGDCNAATEAPACASH